MRTVSRKVAATVSGRDRCNVEISRRQTKSFALLFAWTGFSIYFRSTTEAFAPTDADAKDADKGGENRLTDELHHIKFSDATWSHDDKGVFYQTYPKPEAKSTLGSETDPNKEAKLFYHLINGKQSDDRLICGVDPAVPTGMWSTEVSDDGRFLLLTNSKNTDPKSRAYVAPLNDDGSVPGELKWISLADKFESQLSYLASDGTTFYFMTNKDAPRYRIVKATFDPSEAKATQEPWSLSVGSSVKIEDLVPEDKDDAVLSSATVIDGDKLLLVYSRNVIDELWLHDLKSGKQIQRLLPNLVGSIGQISGKREDNVAFVSSSSFVSPGTITRLQWSGGKAEEIPEVKTHRATKVKGIQPEDYVSEQKWFESVDGTRWVGLCLHMRCTKLMCHSRPSDDFAGYPCSSLTTRTPSWTAPLLPGCTPMVASTFPSALAFLLP